MDWTKEIQDALTAPFPEDEIEFLPRATTGNRALALAHIDARSVMRRLDAVVGPANWSFDFEMLSPDGKKVKGKLTVLGITKCDAGEASTEDEPLKAAVSDALKRCGVHFGIGRYLYYLPQTWADYDPQKRRFAVMPRLPAGAVERALAVCGYQGSFAAADGNGTFPQQDEAPAPPVREKAPLLRVESSEPERPARGRAAAEAEQDLQGGLGPSQGHPPTANPMTCATPDCGKPLTKGQHDISIRAFGRPLCPACQRQQARVA